MAIPTSVENVTYNSPDGAVVGKSATDKIAFFGSTPVVQPASASQTALAASSATATTTQLRTELTAAKLLLSRLRNDLKTLGLIKGLA